MGLLTTGTPLTWDEIIPYIEYIKEHGVIQFINLYNCMKNRPDDTLKWGDEIEYILVKFDHDNKKVRVSLCADDILPPLQAREKFFNLTTGGSPCSWIPEIGSYMIEATPGAPYKGIFIFSKKYALGAFDCFNDVEESMKFRRIEASRFLYKNESILSMTFPSLGSRDFTDPPLKPTPFDEDSNGQSIFFPDEANYQKHPRFPNLVRKIRERRGEKVAINIPIFKDTHTPSSFIENFDFLDADATRNALPDHIYLDHTCFGLGNCCLQVTFQAKNLDEARWLYDQMTPVTPILVALSAATPIFRSYLVDVDSRLVANSMACDDRTPEERGHEPLSNNKFVIQKSRYDTTSCYIHQDSAAYNDIPLPYDENLYTLMLKGGVDEHLARHIAHLFIRDPLQVYEERIEQDDTMSTEHFESINSSNWNNLRFKPPPPDNPNIGWRVEIRPIEVQLTDFENAAYCCFVILLTRVILAYKLNFLTKISIVDENMAKAAKRDAILDQKFEFRTNISSNDHAETSEMTINEIINGDGKTFIGLIPLIRNYIDEQNIDPKTRCNIERYLTFLSKRASGEIPTLARWMRDLVQSHDDYKHDSYVPDSTIYEMMKRMDEISKGVVHDDKLLGKLESKHEEMHEKTCKFDEILIEEEDDMFQDVPFSKSMQHALTLIKDRKKELIKIQ